MTKQSSDSTRYMIQVGRNRFRRDTWESMKDICAIEGTRLADEIWCAMEAHVSEYASSQKEESLRVVSSHEGPQPDFSMPDERPNSNVFDDLVDETVAKATEDVVEEVVGDERTDRGRVVSSDMFGRYRKQ